MINKKNKKELKHKIKQNISVIVVFVLGLTILASCGRADGASKALENETINLEKFGVADDTDEDNLHKEKEWKLSEIEIPDYEEALETYVDEGNVVSDYCWAIVDEEVYHYAAVFDSDYQCQSMYVQILAPPYKSWENIEILPTEWIDGKECQPWTYFFANTFSEDGKLYVLLLCDEKTYLGTWSKDKGASARPLDDERLNFDNLAPMWVTSWQPDEDWGQYYLYFDGVENPQTLWLDMECNDKKGYPGTEDVFIHKIVKAKETDERYLCGQNADAVDMEAGSISILNRGFEVWRDGEGKPAFTTLETGMSDSDCVKLLSEKEGYLWNTDGIWEFSIEDQTINRIFDSSNQSFKMGIWEAANVCDDGSLLMISKEMGHSNLDKEPTYLWRLEEKDEMAEEVVTIQLATTYADAELKKIVNDFNMKNDHIYVEIRQASGDYYDYRARLSAELVSGEGPDILDSGAAVEVDKAAEKKLLVDLTDIFANEKEKLLPTAWDEFCINGRLYALPYGIQLATLVTDKEYVGEKVNWTLDEMMKIVKDSGCTKFAAQDGGYLYYLLGINAGENNKLIDWENRKCSFGETAEQLAIFCRDFADTESTFDNQYLKVQEGDTFSIVHYLGNVADMYLPISVFENREKYVGFPTEDGAGWHCLTASGFAVNQASEHQAEAIEFLRYLISEEEQNKRAKDLFNFNLVARGFPVNTNSLDFFFELLKEKKDKGTVEEHYYSGGVTVSKIPLSEDKINELKQVIYSAKPINYEVENLSVIIDEEMGSFYSGVKTAEQVMEIIQSRVQLYLDEN